MTRAATVRIKAAVLALLVAAAAGGDPTTPCFDQESSFQKQGCLCSFQEGLTTVRCSFLDGELPSSMSQNYSNVNILQIEGGSMGRLSRNHLQYYPQLMQLSIRNTALQHVDQDTFQNMMELSTLVLENNKLTEFPPVESLTKLRVLSVEGNKISSITKENLPNHPYLVSLQLGGNQITELPVDVFENTCNIANLSLSNSNIREFKYGTFNNGKISILNLSKTKVKQLPTDGLRDYLSEVDLSEANEFVPPSFTMYDESHSNLTYPLLNKITMPFYIHCCQLRSQRVKYCNARKDNAKRMGNLPVPTPSNTISPQATSTFSQCTTSTMVNTVCTTTVLRPLTAFDGMQTVPFFPSVGLVAPTTSPLLSTNAPLSSEMLSSNTLLPSDIQGVAWTTDSASSIDAVASDILSVALSADSISFTAASAPPTSTFNPPATQSSPLSTKLASVSINVLPTIEPTTTPVVSCHIETVAMLCCNYTNSIMESLPTDCSDACEINDPAYQNCLDCYAEPCLSATCLGTAACKCLAAKSSGGTGEGNVTTPICTPLDTSSLFSYTPSPTPNTVPPVIGKCARKIPTYEKTHEYIECLPAENPFTPCEELLSGGTRVTIWIVATVTLLGNGIVVTCMVAYGICFRHKQKQLQVVNFFYLNLAIADFLMGVYLITIGVEDLRTHYGSPGAFFTQSAAWQTSRACNFAGFCAMASISMSVSTLVLITLERVHSIVNVFAFKRMSLKLAAVLVGLCWTFAIIVGALPVAHVSSYGKTALCLPFDSSRPVDAGYVYFVLIFTGLASLVIATSYAVIGCNVFCNRQAGTPVNASRTNECYVAVRMSFIVFSNFACWFPIAVVALGEAAGQDWIDLGDAKVFMVVVFPLNASLNPIIYTLSTRVFRETLSLMSKKCCLAKFVERPTWLWSQPHTRELSTLRRLSLSKTSTLDLFASKPRTSLNPNDVGAVEAANGQRIICAANVISLSSIREVTEFDEPATLVIKNECPEHAQFESAMEMTAESILRETSFSGVVENRATVEE